MNISVSAHDWVIDNDALQNRERKVRLMEEQPLVKIIEPCYQAAMKVAAAQNIHVSLIQAVEQPDFYRVEAKIPLPEMLFDQLFNGRSGYRAQYYLSADHGAAFNRKIVEAFIPAILESCQASDAKIVRQSLVGSYSKIWVVGDGEAFLDSPVALLPARWATYWDGKETKLGLRLPLPRPPQVDVKGTFIRPKSGEEWVSEEKRDRDNDIHKSGWT